MLKYAYKQERKRAQKNGGFFVHDEWGYNYYEKILDFIGFDNSVFADI